ncbi:MAG TPA: excisionase family DNA-binding protein [Candidatus Dormibacteraeota bacterium]|jgi:excisionase family DNA binding protein|nr:excisionase family DNA-binding protein [Candidatus Dormibacteraeota bacterium]
MATATAAPDTVLTPDQEDEELLHELDRRLIDIERSGRRARLVSTEGTEIHIPDSVFHALRRVVEAMGRGQSIILVPQGKVLTTKQAADLLHVSRTFLSRNLLGSSIPFEMVGSHRRVLLDDVLDYRETRAHERRGLLDEMAVAAQEVEGGYR